MVLLAAITKVALLFKLEEVVLAVVFFFLVSYDEVTDSTEINSLGLKTNFSASIILILNSR